MAMFSYEEWKNIVNNLLIQGNAEEALYIVEQLISQLPNDASIRVLLAKVYWLLGHHQDSIKSLQQAVNLEPDNIEYMFYLARSLLKTGEKLQALITISSAITIKPTDLDAGLYYIFMITHQNFEIIKYIWSKPETESLVSFFVDTHANNPLNYNLFSHISLIEIVLGRFDRAEIFFCLLLK